MRQGAFRTKFAVALNQTVSKAAKAVRYVNGQHQLHRDKGDAVLLRNIYMELGYLRGRPNAKRDTLCRPGRRPVGRICTVRARYLDRVSKDFERIPGYGHTLAPGRTSRSVKGVHRGRPRDLARMSVARVTRANGHQVVPVR